MNRWILVGSLVAVFLVTLGFSYGPGYGGSLLAFLGNNITGSPKMSPSDMVTPVVTLKKVVTFKNVTNVTSVSPVMSPLTYDDSQSSSVSPSVSPVTSPVSVMSPTPSAVISVSPTPASTLGMSPQAQTLSVTQSPTPIPSSQQSTKININTAGLEELYDITGVGEKIAPLIIKYRTDNGPFQKIEDIQNVKGIGDGIKYQKMKDQITI